MIKKLLIVVAGLAIFLISAVASRPNSFEVQRSGLVGATPDAVYAQLVDFSRWPSWSPWEQLDPGMKRIVTGTPGTVGHSYSWEGNGKAGAGSMTLTALSPPERISIRLDFLKPWKATDQVTFTVRPEGSGSRVIWTMSGRHNLVTKVVAIFMNMDSMIGKDFEQGLANLKTVAEREQLHAAAPAPAQ